MYVEKFVWTSRSSTAHVGKGGVVKTYRWPARLFFAAPGIYYVYFNLLQLSLIIIGRALFIRYPLGYTLNGKNCMGNGISNLGKLHLHTVVPTVVCIIYWIIAYAQSILYPINTVTKKVLIIHSVRHSGPCPQRPRRGGMRLHRCRIARFTALSNGRSVRSVPTR